MGTVVIQMTEQRLREHLQHAAQLGAHLAMRNAGLPVRDLYTRTEMQRRHGKTTIDNLIAEGLLTPRKLKSNNEDNRHRIVFSEQEFLENLI